MNQVQQLTGDSVRKRGGFISTICCIALSSILVCVLTACDSSPSAPSDAVQDISDIPAGASTDEAGAPGSELLVDQAVSAAANATNEP